MNKPIVGFLALVLLSSACSLTENRTEKIDNNLGNEVFEMDSDLLDESEGRFQEDSILENEANSSEGQNDGVGYFSLSDIAEHSEKDDCWFAINGKVYDVSSFKAHPGAGAIFEGCGKDATGLFETRPMGSGSAHSTRARAMLENFYIGEFLE